MGRETGVGEGSQTPLQQVNNSQSPPPYPGGHSGMLINVYIHVYQTVIACSVLYGFCSGNHGNATLSPGTV